MVLVSLGTVARIMTEPTCKPLGPLRISALKATVPETVPAISETAGVNTTDVLFAGTVNSAVLEPFENRTKGSSPDTTLFEVNEIVKEVV